MSTAASGRAFAFGGAAWLFPMVLAVAVTPFVARGLGAEGYGIWAWAGAFVTFGLFPFLGRALLARSAARPDPSAALRELLPAALTVAAAVLPLLGAALSGAALLLAPPVAGARVAALAVAPVVVLAGLQQLLLAVPQGAGRFDLAARASVLGSVAWAVAALTTVGAGGGPGALTLALGAGPLASTVFLLVAAVRLLGRKAVHPGASGGPRELTGFAGAVLLAHSAGGLYLLVERAALARLASPAEVAFFAAPAALAMQLHSAAWAATRGFLPAVAAAPAGERLRIYGEALIEVVPPVAVMAATLAVISGPLLGLWLGPVWAEVARTPLALLALAFGALAVLVVPWELAEASAVPGRTVALSAAWLVAGGATALFLAPQLGAEGAALGRSTIVLFAVPFVRSVERAAFGATAGGAWRRPLARSVALGGGAAAAEAVALALAGPGAGGLLLALAAGAPFLLAAARPLLAGSGARGR